MDPIPTKANALLKPGNLSEFSNFPKVLKSDF